MIGDKICIPFFIGCALIMSGCGGKDLAVPFVNESRNGIETGDAINKDISLHPSTENGFVGDPMPFFDGKEMNIFFLDDQRNGSQGYHPWARFTTTDFCSYKYWGNVIPCANSIKAQDIALGTGSVIKDKTGVFHAFYTGHNDTYSPKEAIMHATSGDLQHWDKHESDTFYATNGYSSDDFRDPYVFYNDNDGKYWMLITTRKNNVGVVALYESRDLTKWESKKVLFTNDIGTDSNLECPALFEWNGFWYLTFSDQWPDRMVHYRISKSPDGPFNRPERECFDGNGFYAGRPERDAENAYLIGWTATKDGHQDENNYNWGGNLVSHQLTQSKDGLLGVRAVQSIIEKMNHKMKSRVVNASGKIKVTSKKISFSGEQYELATYSKINGSTRISGKIELKDKTNVFGFSFNIGNNKRGTLHFLFNKSEDFIGFFNKETETYSIGEAQSKVPYYFKEGDEIDFTILLDNTTATLYVNNEIALSARMYSADGREWGVFSDGSNVVLKNIAVFK